MAPSPILVHVRLRPAQKVDVARTGTSVISIKDDQVTVLDTAKGQSQSWSFQKCHDMDSSQAEVFAGMSPLIEHVCQGKQATVFTYGSTGSGKTHTMEGTASDPGLMSRSVQALFKKQKSRPAGEMDISLSCMEILNNEVYDLLSDQRKPAKLSILNNGHGEDIVQGLSIRQLSSMAEFELLSSMATSARKTAATALNTASSRSHAIVTLYVTAKVDKEFVNGRLCLADLAGSENTKIAGGNADRMRESREINTSLTTLSKVIDALRNGSTHIPYRDSKLTRVLQPALGGGSSALLICCIAPGDKSVGDTVNTLKFGSRSRQILNQLQDQNKDQHRTSSARTSISSSSGRTSGPASRPTASSARRSTALTDKSNTTSRPKSSLKAGIVRKATVQVTEADQEPFSKKQKRADTDLFEQFSEAYAQTGDEGKTALCLQLLPILGPLVQTQFQNSADPAGASQRTGESFTINANPENIETSLATAHCVEVEVARMKSLPTKERKAIGRDHCRKGRALLREENLSEALKYFRMAKGGKRDQSTLTSLIADIEVNGLLGKEVQGAMKRKRDD